MTDLRETVLRAVADVAGVDPGSVRPDAAFAELGLDSAALGRLSGELEQRLGEPVELAILFEHPTVDGLVARLREGAPATAPVPRERREAEPIALVGLATRLPGAPDLAAFWTLLTEGRDTVGEVPGDRWDVDRYYDDKPGTPGTTTSKWGGFLDDVARFDARFFGIPAAEAARMDPQQRILLEETWHALEDAGTSPERLRGGRVGVYVGASATEYGQRQMRDPNAVDALTTTGGALSVAAGRISYAYDFRGPSIAVDTACSSSLVALHLAVRALRASECDVAVVGGVNVLLGPEITIGLSAAGMMAPDGRCKPFDASADGYVRGEGCVVAVLKPLRDAVRAGDRVYAVVAGTAVNQDGHSNGLTAPNPAAQEEVLGTAYADAGIDPATVSYVECHGTGTFLGDPIEARSVGTVLGRAPGRSADCVIGSVKGNVGHLEAAAGLTGLAKAALAVHHGVIPASLHYSEPNPGIDFEHWRLRVAERTHPWPSGTDERRAGVSSFGFGGTNAHVVLSGAPAEPSETAGAGVQVVPLAARSERALRTQAAAWADAIEGTETSVAEVAASAIRRGDGPYRAAVPAAERGELVAGLRRVAAADRGASPQRPRVVFAFTGQGGQWSGMGRDLMRSEPLFGSVLRRCDEIVRTRAGWSLLDRLDGDDLEDTAYAQPVLVAVQIALGGLLRSYGVEPSAVVGHSVGEVAAAQLAGAITLDEAMDLAVARGSLMATTRGHGRMLAAGLSPDEIGPLLPGGVEIAAVNGPELVVAAGAEDRLQELESALTGRFTRWLDVPYAFHSPQMDEAADALEKALTALRPGETSVPFVSTVTGGELGGTSLDAAYWRRNARETVRFSEALQAAVDGGAVVVEVGPPSLRGAFRAIDPDLRVVRLIERDQDGVLPRALASLYEQGAGIRWERRSPGRVRRADLPPYPFDPARHWRTVEAPGPRTEGRHPLLGGRLDVAGDGRIWQARVDVERVPYLTDHQVFGTAVLPATAYVECMLAAADGAELRDLSFHELLFLDEPRTLQTSLRDGRAEVHSRQENGEWTLHASASVGEMPPAPESAEFGQAAARCAEAVDVGQVYERLAAAGLMYGPEFRRLADVRRGSDEAVAALGAVPDGPYAADPRVLDAALHLAAVAVAEDGGGRIGIPVAAEGVTVHGPLPTPCSAWLGVRESGTDAIVVDVVLHDGHVPAVVLEGLRLQPAGTRQAGAWLYEPVWKPAALDRTPDIVPPGKWLVIGEDESLAAALAADGETVLTVGHGTGYAWTSDDTLLIDLDDAGHYERMFADPRTGGLRGVVRHWTGIEDPAAADSATVAAVNLLRTMSFSGRADLGEVWFVTRGAVSVGASDDAGSPFAAPLLGLSKVVPFENPALRCRCVDLDDDLGNLVTELRASAPDTEIAWRGGRRHVRRLQARTLPPPRSPNFNGPGAYVVTGGMGSLGLQVARWLAESGVRDLALLGRSAGESPELSALRELGARVSPVAVDVADAAALEAALDQVRKDLGPIRGVVHAAGVLADGPLLEMGEDEIREVLAPKVAGAWNLAQATADDDLDQFVLFSSAASLIGSPGQANYCAANAFLDALALRRRREGAPATVVNWGPWAEAGMAARTAPSDGHASMLDPGDGLLVLGTLLAIRHPQAMVLPFNLRDLLQFYPPGIGFSFFKDVLSEDEALLRSYGNTDRAAERPDLARPYVAPRNPVELKIAGIWQSALGLSSIGVLDGFFELGGDSVFANQILAQVNRALGVSIEPRQAFEDFSVARLAALAEEQAIARFAAMSPDEAADLLNSMDAPEEQP